MPRNLFTSHRRARGIITSDEVAESKTLAGAGFSGDGLSGAGIGKKRINEPFHGQQPPMEVFPLLSPLSRRTVNFIIEPKKPMASRGFVNKAGTGTFIEDEVAEAEPLLPGEALKMKLLKQMIQKSKKQKGTGKKNTHHKAIAHELFPHLVKLIDPKLKTPKAGLNKLEQAIKKQPSKTVDIIHGVFKKMGLVDLNSSQADFRGSQALIKQAVDKVKAGQSGTGLFGKNKKWWGEFGRGFKKGFTSTLKVALPIAAILQPELAPLAAAAEIFL